jgi:hypothetical protein
VELGTGEYGWWRFSSTVAPVDFGGEVENLTSTVHGMIV